MVRLFGYLLFGLAPVQQQDDAPANPVEITATKERVEFRAGDLHGWADRIEFDQKSQKLILRSTAENLAIVHLTRGDGTQSEARGKRIEVDLKTRSVNLGGTAAKP